MQNMAFLRKITFILFICLSCAMARGEMKNGSFVSDDEMEDIVTSYVKPLFRTAGVTGDPVIHFLVSPDINAAASVANQLIIFTGFIMKCKNVSQFLGVLAHETGHIAGGHPTLSQYAAAQSAIPALIAAALGGALALAGGSAEGAIAGMAAGATVLERGVLKFSRNQENTADSAAINYLQKLGWPLSGLQSFLDMLDQMYSTGREDLYSQTHPLTPDRMEKIRLYTSETKYKGALPPGFEERFSRLKAKVKGFTQHPQATLREFKSSDKRLEARYARAIALYRSGKSKDADGILKNLMDTYPSDTYFAEMRGQFAFEMGRLNDAAKFFEIAHKRPNNHGVALMYAHCLVELGKNLEKAIDMAQVALSDPRPNVFGWRLLAKAYGKLGRKADASAALAEEAWILKRYPLAKRHALAAKTAKNPRLRQKALDIIAMADRQVVEKHE